MHPPLVALWFSGTHCMDELPLHLLHKHDGVVALVLVFFPLPFLFAVPSFSAIDAHCDCPLLPSPPSIDSVFEDGLIKSSSPLPWKLMACMRGCCSPRFACSMPTGHASWRLRMLPPNPEPLLAILDHKNNQQCAFSVRQQC